MTTPIGPIYLLADSEPLFWSDAEAGSIAGAIRSRPEADRVSAAYIGASNGDRPEFYEIFEAAMDRAGIAERRQIKSRYSAMDDVCLRSADVIVLAGGDVARGWQVLTTTGMRDVIVERHYGGAALIGVSAGAVQLGIGTTAAGPPAAEALLETTKLVPFVVDVHDESNRWTRLRRSVRVADAGTRGLGIPKGGAAVYHPDGSLEPLRHPVLELTIRDDAVAETLLVPDPDAADATPPVT